MIKDLVVYSLLIVASSVMAYRASLPAGSSDSQVVSWVEIVPEQVTSVELAGPKTSLIATRKNERQFFIEFQSTAEEGKEPEKDRFLANGEFSEFLQSLRPLEALRVIGDLKETQASEFGFDSSASLLTIRLGEKAHIFKLGSKQFSSTNRFVYDEERKKVLLINGRHFEKLEKASSRLFERELIELKFDEIKKATVVAGERTRALDHTKKGDDGVPGWSNDDANSRPKTVYANWLSKIEKLRIMSFVPEDQFAQIDSLPAILTLKFDTSKVQDEVVFRKQSTPDAKLIYYAKSNYLGVYVKLASGRMEAIEKDISSIFDEQ
jgi:hypothetical protein